MKLFEHPDFEQAIIRAADHFRPRGMREAIIEKDYYVTEALRIIEQEAGGKIIFKGGTSLSKGWGLIERSSEDVDIFLDPTAFDPELGKKAIDRELKKLRDAIATHVRSHLSQRKARPSTASAATTASSICSGLQAPATSATACLSRQVRPVGKSRPNASGSSPMWGNISRKPASASVPMMKGHSRGGCCIIAGRSWKRCSPSTARSMRNRRRVARLVDTPGTITT